METFKSIALRQQDASAENAEAAPTKTYEDMFNHYKARKEIMAKVRFTPVSLILLLLPGKTNGLRRSSHLGEPEGAVKLAAPVHTHLPLLPREAGRKGQPSLPTS